jgi:cold shock CspA family protein
VIAVTFPLVGDFKAGTSLLEQRCPHIVSRADYRRLVMQNMLLGLGSTARWQGALKLVAVGRDYGFIRGPDGKDYFVHRSEFRGPGRWEDVWGRDLLRVEFAPGSAAESGKSPRASNVMLLTEDA